MSPIYEFRCERCGKVFERYIHHTHPHEYAICGCGWWGRRLWSPLAGTFVEGPGFKEGYDWGLDRYVGSKRQLREEVKLLEEEMSERESKDVKIGVRDE